MNYNQFKLAYIGYCEDGGHGYDPGDIAAAWQNYQHNPEEFEYLKPFSTEQER